MAVQRSAGIGHEHSEASINVQDGDYTLAESDAGGIVQKQAGGAGETYTIPAEVASGGNSGFDTDAFDTDAFDSSAFNLTASTDTVAVFALGTQIGIDNAGGGALTIAITTDVLTWAADGTTGSRTLADGGYAVLHYLQSGNWKITGEGLT